MTARTPDIQQPITVIPVPSRQTFRPGDDLLAGVTSALSEAQVRLAPHDVLLVTSKVVSLTEGALVARDAGDLTAVRRAQARQDAHEIVADAPYVLITRTRHGFVAANGGIDASNLADDTQLLLLPDDPDATATALRHAIRDQMGIDVAVIITDTFGRPWRNGQTDVALGVSGLAPLRDERGDTDRYGHVLDVTEAAVADALAGAADLVRQKASGVPFVVVRGVDRSLFDLSSNTGGAAMVRDADRDLFRFGGATAIEAGLAARRTVRQFDPSRRVDDDIIAAGVRAAITVAAPHHSEPWRFLTLTRPTRTALLDQMATAWQADLAGDGAHETVIAARIARSDAILRAAPTLILAGVDVAAAHHYTDRRRQAAEYDLFLLSGGAAIQNFQVTITAHGAASAWISAPVFCADTIRACLQLPASFRPLGMLAVGFPAEHPAGRPKRPIDRFFSER